MRRIITEIKVKHLLSGTAVVALGSLINSFFSYLLQLFLGRNLSPADFGTFNALLAVFSIVGVVSVVMGISLVKIVSELASGRQWEKITALFWKLSTFLIALGLLILITLYLSRNALSDYMQIEEPLLFLFLGLYILANLLIVAPQSYLQGLLRFRAIALFSASNGLLRLIITFVFVMLGFEVGGVYLGFSLSLLFIYLLGVILLKNNFVNGNKPNIKLYYKKIARFAVPTLFMYIGMLSLNNIDIILVKKYFDADLVGYYAGTVLMGKIILFGASPISTVMYPQISALKAVGKNYHDKFKLFLGMTLAIIFGSLVVYNFLPKFITGLFFGERLISSAAYLPMFSIFISIYVLIHFMIRYFLAIDKTRITLIVIPAVILQYILISRYHTDIFEIMRINILVSTLILVTLGIYLYKLSRDAAR